MLLINDEILKIKQEIGDLKVSLVETGVDVGPAIYLARVFDTDIDTVVKFFIFILIFVFDPMAIALVIAYNKTLLEEKGNENKINQLYEQYKSKPKVKKIEQKEEVEVVVPENLNVGKGGRVGK